METDTTFVRTNGVVVLYAVTHVRLDVAFVVHPAHTELINAVWNAKTLNQVGFVKFWVLVVFFLDGAKHFLYCLMVLRFIRKTTFQVFQYFCCIHNLKIYF